MRSYQYVITMLYAILLSSFADVAFADWPPQGAPVCQAAKVQSMPKIVTDLAGGAIIAWEDYRDTDQDIYAQRVDALGFPVWAADGIAISDNSVYDYSINMLPDGSGGAFLVWIAGIGGDIYAQHINPDGTALWASGGVLVVTGFQDKRNMTAAPDGLGGIFVSWEDWRDASGYPSVFVQRIDYAGFPNWVANGVELTNKTGGRHDNPHITFDGTDSAIIVYEDRDADYIMDIYAQKIDTSGTVAWSDTGVVVCALYDGDQSRPEIISDGAGGAMIVFQSNSATAGRSVKIVRIDSNGDTNSNWAYCGVELADSSCSAFEPQLCSDGAGGALTAWMDNSWHVYAQKVLANGASLWQKNGIPVCSVSSLKTTPRVVSDLNGGAFITWSDNRNGNYVVYAQWIDAYGNTRWEQNGVIVTRGTALTRFEQTIFDPAGYLLLAYEGTNVSSDIFAQRIDKSGNYGNPTPHILDVMDVPHDQGGVVSVDWEASYLDNELDRMISHYSIWRNTSPNPTSGKIDPVLFADGYKAAAFGWEWIKNTPAIRVPNYTYTATTLNDSTSADSAYYYYVVIAHTDDPDVFWMSEPAGGYSIDNLAPSAPQGLAGRLNESPVGARLSWDINTESDLLRYVLYRGAAEDFVPGQLNLLTTTADTVYNDTDWNTGSNFYYKLTAVDIHENSSLTALLRPFEIEVATKLENFHAAANKDHVELTWTLSEPPEDGEPVVYRATLPGSDFVRLYNSRISVSDLTWTCADYSCEPGVEYRYRVYFNNTGGEMDYLFDTGIMSIAGIPLTLYQNFPNPFNPHTSIRFFLPREERVVLTVYNASGQLVRTLSEQNMTSGQKEVRWNGLDNQGKTVSSGVYFYTLRAGSTALTRKMVLLR